jgi:hypothetical protein
MVGRRTAAATVLAALFLVGAALQGPVGRASATPPAGAPPGAAGPDVSNGERHSHQRASDKGPTGESEDDGGHVPAPRAPDPVRHHDKPDTIGGPPAPVTGQSAGEPSVGGAQATTNGADGNEAVSASTAPTPPNGAEPPAAASPGAADTSAAAPLPAETPPSDAPADIASAAPAPPAPATSDVVLDDLNDVLDATGPKPVATGLSPDTTKQSVLVALLAFAVLLFLVGYQLVDRRDPRRDATRDAEAVARFR